MTIQNIETLEKTLLSFKGVKISSISLIGIDKRFCIFSKPFVAFTKDKLGNTVINIKLPTHKANELKLKHSDIFISSEYYKSIRWLSFNEYQLKEIVEKIDLEKLLITSLKTALNELSIHDTLNFLGEYATEYNISAKKVRAAFSKGIMGKF